jgi:hypothetical protein
MKTGLLNVLSGWVRSTKSKKKVSLVKDYPTMQSNKKNIYKPNTKGSDFQNSTQISNGQNVKESFFATVLGDILRAIEGQSLMGAFVLSFCSIDYLAEASKLLGSKDYEFQSTVFIEYLKVCKNLYGNSDKVNTREWWAVRNSLVHNYGHSRATKKERIYPHFIHNSNDMHLKKKPFGSKGTKISINLDDLVADLILDTNDFFDKWKSEEENLIAWYNEIIRPNASIDLHPCLSPVISSGEYSRDKLLLSIQQLYNE